MRKWGILVVQVLKNGGLGQPLILLFIVGAGNELIQYMPIEDFSGLYDVSDLVSSYQPSFDPADADNALLTTPDDVLQTLYYEASQPVATTLNNRQTTEQNGMEHVD